MADVLSAVQKSQAGRLGSGESFLVAAKVVKKTGALGMAGMLGRVIAESSQANPPGMTLADDMVWAVTERRLLVWAADRVTGNKPKAWLGEAELGLEAFNPVVPERALAAGLGKTYLTVTIRGVPVAVEAKSEDARALSAAIGRVLPPPPSAAPPPPPA